jgi:hypothetical protein
MEILDLIVGQYGDAPCRLQKPLPHWDAIALMNLLTCNALLQL